MAGQIDKFQELSVVAPRIYLSIPLDFAGLVPVGHCGEPQRLMPASIQGFARKPIQHQRHPCSLVMEGPYGKEAVRGAQVLGPVEEVSMSTQHLDHVRIAL